jgi:predicted ATPase/transcriptional regulator with XRE-family HTH domain
MQTSTTVPAYATIGQWIKRLRAEHEWTQEALAERVACSTQTIHAIEGGQRRASRDLAERIADVLDVPAEQRDAFVRLARRTASAAPAASEAPVAATITLASAEPEQPMPRLPGAPNALLGRQHEQQAVHDLLNDPLNRLVTLVGPGGAGKSRLALQTAHERAARFTGGAAWVELAPLTSPQEIPTAIAAALGQSVGRSQTPLEELLDLLRPREMLLVLDNFEHLLSGIDTLVVILREVPRTRLLVTSRERLRLHGECVIELDGLTLPADDSPNAVIHSSAVLLFLERARQLDPSFALVPTNQREVARICRLVHGMPLAIELAATWIRTLHPGEIAEEIERSLDFLDYGGRDASPRHRSLRAVFDYSWGLLEPEEQTTLARLSVFRGGCTREAAKVVAGATVPVLAALVDKSLVRRVESVPGTSRYDLHELLRQFAEERLRDAGQVEATRNAHVAWALALAERAHEEILGPDGPRVFATLQAEQGNLRHALAWTTEGGSAQSGLRMAGALKRFWFHRGYLTEGREWYTRVLASSTAEPPSPARGRVLASAGDFANWQGDYDEAIALLDACVAEYEAIGDPLGVARANLILAGIYSMRHDIPHAIALSEASLATFRAHRSTRGITQALNSLGNLLVTQRDFAAARPLYEEQLALARETNNRDILTIALNNLGVVTRQEGDLHRARALHEEALERSESVDSKAGIAWATRNLGAVATLAGEYDDAAEYFKRSLALRWEMREHAGFIWAVEGLAELAAAQGHYERAVRLWAAARALRGPVEPADRTAEYLETEQQIARVRDQMDAAAFDAAWAAGQRMSMEDVARLSV